MKDKELYEIDKAEQLAYEEDREVEEYDECGDCNCEDEIGNTEEIINYLAMQEEIKRIEVQDNPRSKIPEGLKKNKTYKELTEQAYVMGECLQILLGYGVDYSNSVALISNLIQNKINVDLAQVNVVNAEKQSI